METLKEQIHKRKILFDYNCTMNLARLTFDLEIPNGDREGKISIPLKTVMKLTPRELERLIYQEELKLRFILERLDLLDRLEAVC